DSPVARTCNRASADQAGGSRRASSSIFRRVAVPDGGTRRRASAIWLEGGVFGTNLDPVDAIGANNDDAGCVSVLFAHSISTSHVRGIDRSSRARGLTHPVDAAARFAAEI